MKAAQRDRYGPPEVIEIREIERPRIPRGDHVRRLRSPMDGTPAQELSGRQRS